MYEKMQTYTPVTTKRDFVKRYKTGEFGNHSPTWDTLQEYLASEYHRYRLVHIRNRVAGGQTYYNIGSLNGGIEYAWDRALSYPGAKEKDFYISAMAPTEKTILQGEVQRGTTNGLDLFYTTVAKPMRDALATWSRSCNGVVADYLLRTYLCPNSHEWLEILLERYPNHVVEFSSYACNWGTLDNFNTVFWEVRKY